MKFNLGEGKYNQIVNNTIEKTSLTGFKLNFFDDNWI
jgi:hypothetical protein